MSNDDTIKAIQQRMQEVRRELSEDLVTSARDIKDWRSYVRANPWLSLAAATAVGFYLAPKGSAIVRLSEFDLRRLAKEGIVAAPATSPQRTGSRLVRTLWSNLAGLAMRGALTYVSHRLATTKIPDEEPARF